MRRFVAVLVLSGLLGSAFGTAVAEAQAVPYPPPTEPADVVPGECELIPPPPRDPEDSVPDTTPLLVIECGISGDATRLFKMYLSEDEQTALRLFLGGASDGDDDEFEVH
jgi:hypothetical protein